MCETGGSRCCDYEDYSLMGYDVAYFVINYYQDFRGNLRFRLQSRKISTVDYFSTLKI
jgi:hypothetical protein